MTASVTVLNEDCFTFNPADARYFQALITDPPFSPHVHENITSAGTQGAGSVGWHRQELEFEPLTTELGAHVAACAARTQGWVLIHSDHEISHEWRAYLEGALAEYVRSLLVVEERPPEFFADLEPWGVLPWERWSQPQKSGDRPTQGFEVISIFWGRHGSRKSWNGPGNLTSFRHKSMRGADKHRTQKPLDMALDQVCFFTNGPGLPWGAHAAIADPFAEGAAGLIQVPAAVVAGREMTALPAQNAAHGVLDLCGGAATVAVACALLDRDCVTYEKLPQWADLGARRAEDALTGKLAMFDDLKRAERWCEERMAEALAAPFPKAPDGSDVKTWERAQRRLADVERVAAKL